MTARQALEFMERRWFQESPIPTVRVNSSYLFCNRKMYLLAS